MKRKCAIVIVFLNVVQKMERSFLIQSALSLRYSRLMIEYEPPLPLPPPLSSSQLKERREFFEAREIFLGSRIRSANPLEGFAAITVLENEEAKWLKNLFPNGLPCGDDAIRDVFLNVVNDTCKKTMKKERGRALCYATCIYIEPREDSRIVQQIRRVCFKVAAEYGDMLAQSYIATEIGGRFGCLTEDSFQWAYLAAAEYEPEGLFVLARCYQFGKGGCEKDRIKSRFLFEQAALLGYADAMWRYGSFFARDDPHRYFWKGEAWKKNQHRYCKFLTIAANEIDFFSEYMTPPSVIFQIGEILKGVLLENIAVKLFDVWCTRARLAVETWLLIGKRLQICKDVRRIIGKMIWEARGDFADWPEK